VRAAAAVVPRSSLSSAGRLAFGTPGGTAVRIVSIERRRISDGEKAGERRC
jgi:hypothetical protein